VCLCVYAIVDIAAVGDAMITETTRAAPVRGRYVATDLAQFVQFALKKIIACR
jgi:hypothetical protein